MSRTIEFAEITYFNNLLLVHNLVLLSQETGPLRETEDRNQNINYINCTRNNGKGVYIHVIKVT